MSVLDQEYAHLRLEESDGVLVVRLDRAEQLNAVNGPLHTDLTRLLAALRSETSFGAIVLTGAGRAFCAGGDAAWFAQAEPSDVERIFVEARSMVLDLLEIGPPVIAAVNGPAVGLGATLALLCDVVVVDEEASFSDPHVLMGVVAGDGGAAIWPALVGVNRAKQYLLTGDHLDAAEAERIGLVNAVVPAGASLDAAGQWARRLARGPRRAIEGTKRSINQVLRMHVSAAFETSLALERESMSSGEHREALEAFAEGREPDFSSLGDRPGG
ncbi:enoyl-CoA hydratase/isomerase family protein [Aeromicrobium sp. CTD01-1L150]|uniref:enoyl-CoA hydratase/isomerase family protein n=1 Tax=Aeromicrobium sp. CTD01-1L150 TaxID=3341830 RepID=UPI0035C0A86E